jgi:excinuclease UvrABC nuclease subunit
MCKIKYGLEELRGNSGKKRFSISGVYFLYFNTILIYIGQSKNIYFRIKNHIGMPIKKFNKFGFVCTNDPIEKTILEKRYISNLCPFYNRNYLIKKYKYTKGKMNYKNGKFRNNGKSKLINIIKSITARKKLSDLIQHGS